MKVSAAQQLFFLGTEAETGSLVVRSESVRNIIRERRMLEHLNHPFLCNLRYSFQDVEYLLVVSSIRLSCMLSSLQVHRRGSHERGRPSIPHLEEDVY